MDEIRLSDWPEPPGSTAWLPAYGFAHDMEKDDFFASAAGETGSTQALYLETIVEETSDDLRSERSSAATWLTDSDADSVIHVTGGAPGSECDSGSEREFACPAKRRRRERAGSPASDDSLSRSSSLAQFESLERSCAATSISPDSLESASSGSDATPSSPDSGASGRTLRAPAACRRPARAHLSAENLSEDSGYSELRAPGAPSAAALADGRTEIARGGAGAGAGGGSAPCLAARPPPSPERARPPHAARLRAAASVPADLDLCAEPPRARRRLAHRAHFRQSFEVCEGFTVSVADLTALDYRGGPGGGGARPPARPRLPPPPPPPRAAPPPPPPREPSAGSDSTTESERAFTREMEVTADRLDEDSRRVLLAAGGDLERDISVLTARRLREASWGAWDDVLDELRRRRPPASPSGSPPRSPPRSSSPPRSPRRRRSRRTPSPEPSEPSFRSTPLRCGDARVRSTPELRARPPQRERRETPEELRASLQEVSPPPPPPPPPARSASSGSKGVTFSPIVAEVSWREVSASGSESARSESASDDAADAEIAEVGAGEVEGSGASRRESSACARGTQRAAAAGMQDAGARPRSRIAGFLSRFANFRFSARKSEKKTRSAGASASAPRAVDESPAPPAAAQFVHIPLRAPTSRDVPRGAGVTAQAVGEGRAAAGAVAHKPPRPARPPPGAAAAPRAPAAGVLETDVDTARTVLHARSLLALAGSEPPSCRPHKSMEFLLDKENARVVQPPENELQKNSDRVLSEHELRVQRSLQKLNVPEWYKNAATPREGFLLRKRLSDASSSARWSPAGLNSKTTSLGSLGQQPPPAPLAPHQLSPATTSFGRWSTSRLNSNQTSPCSSTRSSVRGGTSPLCSPSARSSFSARQPYLGWRSRERLACSSPRTPHERLASSLLAQSPTSRASEEIQSSIKEVTSAIVHYVSGLEPSEADTDELAPSPRGSQKLYWLESSFVGTKPLESPQTPLVSALPPPHPRPPSSLRLDLQRAAAAPEWQCSQRSLVGVALTRPSPGSTTLEDVLDSLLGLPAAPAQQPSPRRPARPYYLLGGGEGPRYEPLSNSSLASKTFNNQSTPSEDGRTERSSSARSGGSRASDASDSGERERRRSADSTHGALAPGRDTVDNAVNTPDTSIAAEVAVRTRRPRSAHAPPPPPRRRSEPSVQPARSVDHRTGCDARAASRTSLDTDSGEETLVRCRRPRCAARATPAEARRHYRSCHNCSSVYCSRECRRAHWEKHRKVCLHSRASALCRRILSTAKDDADSLHRVSAVARGGYLARGRGVVKVTFGSPEAAEKFTTFGFRYLAEPEYARWTDLQPTEMGAELYTEVVRLCEGYDPETRLILFVAVCILSEVPTKGAVRWERRLVSRCGKLRLDRSVSAAIQRGSSHHSARRRRDSGEVETLVLTWKGDGDGSAASRRRHRETCLDNTRRQLERRGIVLDDHPVQYGELVAYARGETERLPPVTLHATDARTGRHFACVIAAEGEAIETTGRVTAVNVAGHQISTPM